MENRKNRKPKRGRPVKEKEKLTTSINLKLTEKDFNAIRQKAEKLGMKATQYAREMTLKGGVKSRFTLEELDLMRKLAGMANNLNQIAKQANTYGYSNTALDVMMVLEQLKKLLYDR